MSDIKWCDIGGHAFSVNDPLRKSFSNVTDLNERGERERIDICGPCVTQNKMGVKTLSIESADAKPEPATVDDRPTGNYDGNAYSRGDDRYGHR